MIMGLYTCTLFKTYKMKFLQNKNTIVCILLLIISFHLQAQKISGTVIDADNNPLEYANVILRNAKTNQLITGVVTSNTGSFEINLKKAQKIIITISFIGYKSIIQNQNITKAINLGRIVLKEDTNLLESITITATKPMLSRRQDKLVFNVQNSPLKVNSNGLDILRQTPLLWVEENSIRMRNEAVVVFINNRKLNLTGEELANYVRNIPSENIKSIEITSNKSAQLDANSKGGSINIVLLKKALGFKGSVNTAYKFAGEGYYQTYATTNFNYGAEKWNIYGNYNNIRYTGLRRININSTFSQQQNKIETISTENYDQQRHYSQFGFVSSLNNNHEIGLEVFSAIVNEKSPIIADFSFYNNQILEDKGIISTTNIPKNNLFTAVLNYSWKFDNKQSLKIFADYLNQHNTAKRTTTSKYSMGNFTDTNEKYDSDATAVSYAFQTDYTFQASKKTKVETGFKYGFIDKGSDLLTEYVMQNTFIVDPNRTTSLDYKEKISAGYLSVNSNITDKDFLKIGIRIENTNLKRINNYTETIVKQNYSNWFPSIFYSRKLSPTNSLSASYSRSIQRPSFQLLSNEIQKINDFNFIIGNPDLNPEFKDAYEVSYQHKKNVVSLFYNRTTDNINAIYSVENDIAYLKNQNIGTQVEYGLEYGSSKKIANWWRIQYSMILFHSKFLNENDQSNFERTSLFSNFSTNFTLNNSTHFDVIGRYISPTTAPYNTTEAYHSFIFVFKKSFFKKKLQLRVTLDDVFNTIKYNSINTFNTYKTYKSDKPMTQKLYIGLTYNFSSKATTSTKRNRSQNDAKSRL